MLGSRRGTLVLLPPALRGRLALHGHHADARASRSLAQSRIGVEVYACAAPRPSRLVRAVARSRVRVPARGRAQTPAAHREAGAAARVSVSPPSRLRG